VICFSPTFFSREDKYVVLSLSYFLFILFYPLSHSSHIHQNEKLKVLMMVFDGGIEDLCHKKLKLVLFQFFSQF